ncbi:hypothetical protein A7A08_01641 [Methyloligella halotolerans]|uniref:Uncharacterized protein n=1 Tax=Methyloligella halotolerans TaxID=1177755 RepID=A0A1E2RZE4_9HYPH|nr:hypothetical protein [Methyloligella halotolerans]ODA67607.1 hypothetical protein A7A08_01641 [Methyloligella halotolerans]
MLKPILAAIGLTVAGAMATTAATADSTTIRVTPAVQSGPVSAEVTPVKHWRHDDDWRYSRHHRHHDRWDHDRRRHAYYDHHYRRPPPGWRSYRYQPYGWRDRGCLAIGPVWYCP